MCFGGSSIARAWCRHSWLQTHVHRGRDRNGDAATQQHTTRPPSVLEIFQEAREGIPEETWQALPQDLAAQHDHYIYGTPKHP